MTYSITSNSVSKKKGSSTINQTKINFGTTSDSSGILANPAELFLASFSACILKNVERFSEILNFDYSKAQIIVNAIRLEKPPRIDQIEYVLEIYSKDSTLNIDLLKKNIEKFGTIFNTVQYSCCIKGEIKKIVQ